MVRSVLFLCCVCLFSACAGRFYKIPTPEYDKSQYEEIRSDSVTATGVHLFHIFPINLNDKLERAIEQLIARNGGDSITDIEVQERWFWAYVLNGYKTKVSGKVLKKK